MEFQPDYELTLFRPRSEDPPETQPLQQLEDAGETFVVTTDGTDARPYLDTPQPAAGRIQLPSRRVEPRSVTARILDARASGDGASLDRWLTRFLGDARGRNRLLNCRARLRERLTEAGGYQDWFTGRVRSVRLARSKLWVDLELKDLVEELEDEIFAGPPDHTLGYAQPSVLLPNAGVISSWGGLPLARRLHGVAESASTIRINHAERTGGRTIVTQALRDILHEPGVLPHGTLDFSFSVRLVPRARVWVRITGGPRTGEEGVFWLAHQVPVPGDRSLVPERFAIEYRTDDRQHWRAIQVGIHPLRSDHPQYMAPITPAAPVEFYVFHHGPPTPRLPILIEAHPVQLIEDALAGRFGPLAETPDEGTIGEPILSFPADGASIAALKADPSFGTARLAVEQPSDLRELIEDLALERGLAYRIDEAGQLVLLDWRLDADDAAGVQTIADADVYLEAPDAAAWDDELDGAITRVEVTHYSTVRLESRRLEETDGFPDVPPVLLEHQANRRIHLLSRYGDLNEESIEIDARGIRAVLGLGVGDQAAAAQSDRAAVRVVDQFRGPFGDGLRRFTLRCRRTAVVTSCREGDLRRIEVSPLPDPATNRRGGARLGRCIGRVQDGPAILVTFLDLGADTVSLPPALGAVAQHAAAPRHALDAPVTLNAGGDPVELEYAVTATSVGVRPAVDSELWTPADRLTAAGTAVVTHLPSGSRIWLRARSVVGDTGTPRLPSSWVFPAASFVDTDALPAPTNLQAAAVGTTIRATCDPGDPALPLAPVAAVDPAPVEDFRAPLPPGSERFVFAELLELTTYTVGFKHVDDFGGESAVVSTQVATGPADQLLPPRRLQVRQGRSTLGRDVPALEGRALGYGLWVSFHPHEPLAQHRVQASPDPAFATLEADELVEAGEDLVAVLLQRDAGDAERYVRIRAERPGFTESDWSEIVSARPLDILARPGPDIFPAGEASLRRRGDGQLELHVSNAGDDDTERAHYAVVVNPVDPSDYPDVDEQDLFVDRAEMPYDDTVDDGLGGTVSVDIGDLVLAQVRFWSAAAGFGQRVLIRMPVVGDATNPPPVPTLIPGRSNPVVEYWTAAALAGADGFPPAEYSYRIEQGAQVIQDWTAWAPLDGGGLSGLMRVPRHVRSSRDLLVKIRDTAFVESSPAVKTVAGSVSVLGGTGDIAGGIRRTARDAGDTTDETGRHVGTRVIRSADGATPLLDTEGLTLDALDLEPGMRVGTTGRGIDTVDGDAIAGRAADDDLDANQDIDRGLGRVTNAKRLDDDVGTERVGSKVDAFVRGVGGPAGIGGRSRRDAGDFIEPTTFKIARVSPVYSADGSTRHFNPETGEVENSLVGPSNTLQDVGGRIDGVVWKETTTVTKQLARGLQSGAASDGGHVNLSSPFQSGSYEVLWLPGGVLQTDGLSGKVGPLFQALNKTGSGFDVSLRLTELAGSITPRSAAFSSGATQDDEANKGFSAEAWDDRYIWHYEVTVQQAVSGIDSSVEVEFWYNTGSGWVLAATKVYTNPTETSLDYLNETRVIVINGMGLDDDFGLTKGAETGFGGSITADEVTWEEAVAPSDETATPVGAPPVPFLVLA